MKNAGLYEAQAGMKIARRNINNLRYADDTMLMASGSITSWEIDGETVKTVTDLYFLLVSKITADGDCTHKIKRYLLPGRKVMTNLDSMLKTRDITNKGPSSQSYAFSSSHV